MNHMFNGCSSLKEINLSSFNTSNLKDMGNMFYNCKSITSLNLGNFTTDKVENMREAFSRCQQLNYIDIRRFSSKKLNNINYNVFQDVSEYGTIYFNSALFGLSFIYKTNINNWKKYDFAFIDNK